MRYRKAYIEITNICNLNCPFCPGTRRAPRRMSRDEFARVLGEVRPLTDTVMLHLMGEPLTHPLLPQFLSEANRLGVRVNLVTNGTLLGERGGALLEGGALNKVSVSLHSFAGGSHPGAKREAYLAGVAAFVRAAAARNIAVELRLWNGTGEANAAGRRGEDAQKSEILSELGAMLGVPLEGEGRAADRLHVSLAERFDWPSQSGSLAERERGTCYGLRDQFGVLADGTVVPCCLDSEGELALGNLFVRPLAEILRSPEAERIREGFRAGRPAHALCRRCGYASRFPVKSLTSRRGS